MTCLKQNICANFEIYIIGLANLTKLKGSSRKSSVSLPYCSTLISWFLLNEGRNISMLTNFFYDFPDYIKKRQLRRT